MNKERVTKGFKPGHLYIAVIEDIDWDGNDYMRYGALAFHGSDGEWYDADTLEITQFDFDYCIEQSGAFCRELAN